MPFGLFAGLSALGGIPKGYQEGQQSQLNDLSISDAKTQALAKVAQGNALALLGGGAGGGGPGGMPQPGMAPPGPPGAGGPPGGPPAAQPPPPGVASLPSQPPPGGPPQPQFPPGGAGGPMPPPQGAGPMPPGAPPWAQQGMPGAPGVPPMRQQPGMAPMQAMRPPPMQGGPPGAPPGGGPPPGGMPMRPPMPQQPPMGGGGMSQPPPQMQQGMRWQDAAQMIAKANPGIKPEVLAGALQQMMPMMNAQSRIDFQTQMLNYREQQLFEKQLEFDRRAGQGDRKLDQGDTRIGQTDTKIAQSADKTKQGEDDTAQIVKGIASGEQPPVLTGLYGKGAAVRAGLEKTGFDLGKAQLEWQAAQRQTASLNGSQMTRFTTLASTVDNTIGRVKDLSEQMRLKGIPLLNQVELQAYIQAQGDTPNSKLAVQYMTAVNGLKEEFANLANGGYAPTGPAWKLANQQIDGNYSVGKLSASLDEVQRLIRYRLQAIQSKGGGENRYEPAAPKPQQPSQGGGTQVSQGAPQPGTVQDGYRFKGGDPSKPESWEQVQ